MSDRHEKRLKSTESRLDGQENAARGCATQRRFAMMVESSAGVGSSPSASRRFQKTDGVPGLCLFPDLHPLRSVGVAWMDKA